MFRAPCEQTSPPAPMRQVWQRPRAPRRGHRPNRAVNTQLCPGRGLPPAPPPPVLKTTSRVGGVRFHTEHASSEASALHPQPGGRALLGEQLSDPGPRTAQVLRRGDGSPGRRGRRFARDTSSSSSSSSGPNQRASGLPSNGPPASACGLRPCQAPGQGPPGLSLPVLGRGQPRRPGRLLGQAGVRRRWARRHRGSPTAHQGRLPASKWGRGPVKARATRGWVRTQKQSHRDRPRGERRGRPCCSCPHIRTL